MELSSDNIEEIAKALASDISNRSDVFQMKTDLASLDDVDRVISEAQDSLLKTSMEAIRDSVVPCSFNDILDDICNLNNNIELQQAAVNSTMHRESLETPAFYHMPDLEMESEDFTSHTDFLQPLGQWSDYLPLPPSALSNIQDIPQLSPIPRTKTPSPPVEPVANLQTNSPVNVPTLEDTGPNPDTSEPITPQQCFNYQYTISPAMLNNISMQQTEVPNTNLQFTQGPEANINFMVLPEPTAEHQFKRVVQQSSPPYFDWARVVPRRAFIQPSEIVVLRPLRTRKLMSTRPTFDIASYFDTSSISIPMIREGRPRPKQYRRKQKLYTIPEADNLIFSVQLDADVNGNYDEEQLYPETEIAELDEIFKRKRGVMFTAQRNTLSQGNIKSPSPSLSHVEVPHKITHSTPSTSPKKEPAESFSDVDSDDAPLTVIKSMKCPNCKKFFKTCRSLTIHSKRCKTVSRSPKNKKSPQSVNRQRPSREVKVQNYSGPKENFEVKKNHDEGVGRPLTRSQTRSALKRKLTDHYDGGGPKKLSK